MTDTEEDSQVNGNLMTGYFLTAKSKREQAHCILQKMKLSNESLLTEN